jgi:hypothetical protein
VSCLDPTRDEHFTTAVSKCETAAKVRGHTLGGWHPMSKRMYIIGCVVCNEITWITRSGDEEHWRIGGQALVQTCLEED